MAFTLRDQVKALQDTIDSHGRKRVENLSELDAVLEKLDNMWEEETGDYRAPTEPEMKAIRHELYRLKAHMR